MSCRRVTSRLGATIFQEYIENGTWVKLRELSATWTIPSGLLGRLGTHGAALTLAGRNLHTLDRLHRMGSGDKRRRATNSRSRFQLRHSADSAQS